MLDKALEHARSNRERYLAQLVDLLRIPSVSTLPEHQREVLHLVFYEEMSVRETADVLGIPEGTVKSRMYNARKTLAKELT